MISRAPFSTTPAEARQSVCIVTLMGSGAAAPLRPRPPKGCAGGLSGRSSLAVGKSIGAADNGDGLINQPSTR